VADGAPWSGVGIALPCVDALGRGTPVVEVARAAQDVGLDHVWVPDHLVFHRPIIEATTALACVAGATDRIRLGTAILNPTLRPVVWLAKQLTTLATLAPDPEFRAAGIDRKGRGRRLDEALELLPKLAAGEPVVHRGAFEVDCDALAPTLDAFPPVLVGGRGDAAIRRAARFADAWFPMWLDPDEIGSSHERLGELAAEHGRSEPGVALVAFVNVCEDRATGEAHAAELIRRQYGMPYERVSRWTLVGSAAEVTERLAAYVAAGVQGFCLSPAHPQPIEQIHALAEIRAQLEAEVVAR